MKYNKLVRDKIPAIIKQNGDLPVIHIANNKEYYQKLKEKIKEEVAEFIKTDDTEELADILEVVYAIGDYKKFSPLKLARLRKIKLRKRGGFKKKIILEETKTHPK